MTEKPIIEVKHLSKNYQIGMDKTYKRFTESVTNAVCHPLKTIREATQPKDSFWALKDVNFEVERGEVLGIIGRNGAGKSTLLKVLSRITYPTEGEIVMRGRVGSLLEVGTGFHPELTGRENIYFNGAILGMKKREIDDKFDEIVKFSGVEKFLDTPVKRYSSGMNVRLAFSVAAHLEPEILLVDEVLAVGDAEFQKKCLGKMGEVAKEGRTVLFVSHNMGAIAELCSKCIYLYEGHIAEIGETREMISQYIQDKNEIGEIDLTNWLLDRTVKGPMRVDYLCTKNKHGEISHFFEYGEPIYFDLQISGRAGKRCIIALSIRNEVGHIVLHLHNLDDRKDIILVDKINTIQVCLDKILLNDGKYSITIWLADEINILNDRIGNCLSFTVSSSHICKIRSQGCFRYPATWRILNETIKKDMIDLV